MDNIAENELAEQPEKLGKFDSADELLSAYNALESEFTKRCQLLKQLQAELNALRAQDREAKLPPETVENEGMRPSEQIVEPEMRASGRAVSSAFDDSTAIEVPRAILDNIEEYASVLAAVPEIMDACIERYKRKLIGERGVAVAAPRGMAVIVPTARPKTLQDAKRIAEQLLG